MHPSLLSPFRWLSPAGSKGRLSIFIFHRVLERPDPLLPDEPDVAWFDEVVSFIASRFCVMRLADAATALTKGRLPAAAACITFDDGYVDNLTVAAPVLQRHGVSATFFIATGFTGGGRMWNDTVIEAVRKAPGGALDWTDLDLGVHELSDAHSRVLAYGTTLRRLKHLELDERTDLTQEIGRRAGLAAESDLMMSREQLRLLRDMGMDLGGHTRTHPILSRLDPTRAAEEIGAGCEELRAWVGQRPTVFAYPNGEPVGDYTMRDVALVRAAGFDAAVSTAQGVALAGADLWQLPRFTPWDRTIGRFSARCALNTWRGTHPARATGN